MFTNLLRNIFANKLIIDNRIDNPFLTFNVFDRTCSFLLPEFIFYFQLVAVIVIQSSFNAILASLVYKILISKKEKKKKDAYITTTEQLIFAFGFGIPIVVLEPIYMIDFLDIQNVGLKMVFLATPIVNSLRIAEALYGFTPNAARKNMHNYIIYFSCAFGISFDTENEKPKRVSFKFLSQRLTTLGRDFIIVSFVMSILNEYDYEFFDTTLPADSLDHSMAELFSWQHLLNNFFVAVLISFTLSQSSLGVSFVYNIIYGYQTYEIVLNPMFKSTSPSEFWGKRWNTLVHCGLKNGVYKPTRRHTSSKTLAVLAAFAVSGLIHEYVNVVMFGNDRGEYQFKYKQMLFFGWNAVLIALEYSCGKWRIFQWMSQHLPQFVITALVLTCALPLAHLFTGDWVKHGYFDAVYIAEPILVCKSSNQI